MYFQEEMVNLFYLQIEALKSESANNFHLDFNYNNSDDFKVVFT